MLGTQKARRLTPTCRHTMNCSRTSSHRFSQAIRTSLTSTVSKLVSIMGKSCSRRDTVRSWKYQTRPTTSSTSPSDTARFKAAAGQSFYFSPILLRIPKAKFSAGPALGSQILNGAKMMRLSSFGHAETSWANGLVGQGSAARLLR